MKLYRSALEKFVSLARGWYRYVWCNLDDKESASNYDFSMTGPVKKPGAVVLGKTSFTGEFSSGIGSNCIKISCASPRI